MSKKQKPTQKKQAAPKNSRPTIALLTPQLEYKTEYDIWRGLTDAAQEHDVNLMSFVGKWPQQPEGFGSTAAAIYNLVAPKKFDGLVIVAGSLLQYLTTEQKEAFIKHYQSIPVVTLEGHIQGVPDVYVDSFQNMQKLVRHLIEVHHYQRIAFIHGPQQHQGIQERYRAYQETLAEYNLPLEPELVTPPVEWGEGARGISWLLDEQQAEFEAVIAPADAIATGAMQELQSRGISVPQEVAMVGYDDAALSRWLTPALTTVPIKTYRWGRKAMEMVLDLIEGKPVPDQVAIPTEVVVRESCGCMDPVVVEVARRQPAPQRKPASIESALYDILTGLKEGLDDRIELRQVEKVANAFLSELTDEAADGQYLTVLNEILIQAVVDDEELLAWHEVLTNLRRFSLPYLQKLADDEMSSRAVTLYHQSRILLGRVAQRRQGYRRAEVENQLFGLQHLGAAFITALDSQKLVETLAVELPRLGIPQVYLSLYENPETPHGQAKLIFAYNETGTIDIDPDQQKFPASELLPAQFLSEQAESYNMLAFPLYFRREQLGFVLFKVGPDEGFIYETLAEQISNAFKSANLAQEGQQAQELMTKRATELELVAQVNIAISKIMDTTDLLQDVVDLIKDGFELYHAHIYLLNQAANALVLAAGAGSIGQQMAAEKWHIRLDKEQSLVAQAARERQGVVANNVYENPHWLAHHLLPDTRSELAVPLLAGDRLIGVLDVQSDQTDFFTEEDIRLKTTLAAQIAMAVEKSWLFEETQSTLTETAMLYQASRRINEAGDLQEIMGAIAEAGEIPEINRVVLEIFEHNPDGNVEALNVIANWYSGQGIPAIPVGMRFSLAKIPYGDLLLSSEPVFIDDVLHDERLDYEALAFLQEAHTQSLALLPLWVSNRQIGVLILYAEQLHAFTPTEKRLYASLARQVAVAVENQRLLAETQSILTEMEATQRRYTIQAWGDYRAAAPKLSFEYMPEQPQTAPGSDSLPAASEPVMDPSGNGRQSPAAENDSAPEEHPSPQLPAEKTTTLEVPLKIRGEVIGLLGLEEIADREAWSNEERELVEAIAEQVAQAAENLRLIDETQQSAARESRVNEIGEMIQSAQSIEEALRIAVREVGRSLKVPQTAVQLKLTE